MLSISKHLLISFREWLHSYSSRIVGKRRDFYGFSSLSESGFIPTWYLWTFRVGMGPKVLISFREWLHSYSLRLDLKWRPGGSSSHLFQRVASFLHSNYLPSALWLLSEFSSLSESGFIPTRCFQFARSRSPDEVLISFREWLHSYCQRLEVQISSGYSRSHLFQRVASFLRLRRNWRLQVSILLFSSLSESGFIPTQ